MHVNVCAAIEQTVIVAHEAPLFEYKNETKPKSQLGRLLLAAVVVVMVRCRKSNRAHSKIDLSELLHTHNHRADSKPIRKKFSYIYCMISSGNHKAVNKIPLHFWS